MRFSRRIIRSSEWQCEWMRLLRRSTKKQLTSSQSCCVTIILWIIYPHLWLYFTVVMGIDNHNMEIYYSILHFQDIFDEKRICNTVWIRGTKWCGNLMSSIFVNPLPLDKGEKLISEFIFLSSFSANEWHGKLEKFNWSINHFWFKVSIFTDIIFDRIASISWDNQ